MLRDNLELLKPVIIKKEIPFRLNESSMTSGTHMMNTMQLSK